MIPPRVTKRAFLRANRIAAWEASGGVCAYCGHATPDDLRTIDHVMPLSLGGERSRRNTVPSCRTCNQRKANLTLEQFRDAEMYRTWALRGRFLFFFEKENWS